jgi:hypothetical protein
MPLTKLANLSGQGNFGWGQYNTGGGEAPERVYLDDVATRWLLHGDDWAEKLLLHEWAHYFQRGFSEMPTWLREGGAEAFAQAASPRVFNEWRNAAVSYPAWTRRVRNQKSRDWIMRGQFGLGGGGGGGRSGSTGRDSGGLPSWVHGSSVLNADQLASLAHYVRMKNPALMGQIAMGESSGNPLAVGDGGASIGLWQIHTGYHPEHSKSALRDPLYNARAALEILNSEGIGAWHASPTGPKGNIFPLLGGTGASAGKPTFGVGPAWTQAMGVGSGMNLSGGVGAATQLIGGLPSRRVLDRIKHLRRLTPILEEQIANAEIWASMPNSPAGEALSNTEKAEQIKLVTTLLGTLKTRRSLITHALGQIGPGHKKLTGSLSQELQGLQGLTGHGGSILQTIQKLALLGASSTFESEAETARITEMNDLLRQLLKESNLRYAVQSAQTQALLGHAPFAGSFRTGGVVPGAIGSPQVAMVHGGETITPAGGGDIHLHFAPGTEWLRDFVEVTVDKRNRRAARRGGKPMPGRAGVLGG